MKVYLHLGFERRGASFAFTLATRNAFFARIWLLSQPKSAKYTISLKKMRVVYTHFYEYTKTAGW